MCYLTAFGHENGTCIGELRGWVVVSEWICYLNAFGHENGTCIGELRGRGGGESVDVLFESECFRIATSYDETRKSQ